MGKSFRLGLTGGIGSGKSTVAALLSTLGAAAIDADAISRATTAPGGLAVTAIRQTFGAEFITVAGALDRDRMRALAYADAGARQRLEAIIHPLVAMETRRQAVAAETAGQQCLVFDVPLLVESAHWREEVDQVLVVDCTNETQIVRTMARGGLTRTTVLAIIASQVNRTLRLKAADAVIFNDGISLEALMLQVRALATGFGLSSHHHSEPFIPA